MSRNRTNNKKRKQGRGGRRGVSSREERMIPYLEPHFSKRTQIIETRLYFSPVTITTAAGTAYTTVAAISLGSYQGFANLVGQYGEYRPIRGEMYYTPFLHISGNSGGNAITVPWGGAVIDYSNSTAIASFAQLFKADTKKMMFLYSAPEQKLVEPGCVQRWSIRLDQLPDQEWISNSTTNTNFCWWKPYVPSTASVVSAAAGYLWGWMDFQFRASAAV